MYRRAGSAQAAVGVAFPAVENPRRRLSLVVFLAGVASLATEVTGARLLAPYFGTSNVVWANVIGMTLLYLSVGYWLGGRLADRHPNMRALAIVVMVAACTVAILPFATRPLFDAATSAFADLSAGAFVASFAGTLLMFARPDHVPGRGRAVGDPPGGHGRARGRHGRRAPLRPARPWARSSAPSCPSSC